MRPAVTPQPERPESTPPTVTVYTLRDALEAIERQDEPIVLDPNGDELFADGSGGLMYADGASALTYGPFSG